LAGPNQFRPLSTLLQQLTLETLRDAEQWPDAGLVREGLSLFEELPRTAPQPVVLATDLHAGNVLRAQREPWLMIDPKPFAGDPAYDVVQHLLNCEHRLQADPDSLIHRVADLAQVNADRVRMWLFARAAAEPRTHWDNHWKTTLARTLQ